MLTLNNMFDISAVISALNRIRDAVAASDIKHFNVYTDATRPGAGTVSAGYVFFNSSDNFLNVSDGANWRDPTGAVT